MRDTDRTQGSAAGPIALAAVLVLVVFYYGAAAAASMQDDGFLWYGVERVLAGEVPIRDFQAYDPGRYYWIVAFSPVFGSDWPGIIAAVAVFAWIGLSCGLCALRRVAQGHVQLVVGGLLLTFWMFPQRKAFGPALAMIGILLLVRLIERPSVRCHLVLGLFVGLAAFFGRNYGLYVALASLVVMPLLEWKLPGYELLRSGGVWAAGVVVGYLPMIAMLAFVPGLWDQMVFGISRIAERGTRELAYPLPWRMVWDWSWSGSVERAALACAYLLPLVVLPVGAIAALLTRRERLVERAFLVAAATVGCFYFHHAAVTSNIPHLAQSLHPALMTGLALPAAWASRGKLLPIWLAIAIVLVNPTFHHHQALFGAGGFERPPAGQVHHEKPPSYEPFLPDPNVVAEVLMRVVPAKDKLYAAHNLPGLYVLTGRVSPLWSLYVNHQSGHPELQRRAIRDLEDVRWIVVRGRQLRIDQPMVWQYISENYLTVPVPDLPTGFVLYRRRR